MNSILFITIILTSVSTILCATSGPLSPGAYRLTLYPSSSLEIGVARTASIEFMTSDWTLDTSVVNQQVSLVGVQGTLNILYAQQFENANLNYSLVVTGGNKTTNFSVDSTVSAKGSASSAKLGGGFQTDFTGPWLDFGVSATPVRISAYMRASSAGIGGASMALSLHNDTGYFPAVQVLFDADNKIKLKNSSGSFSNSTPFSPNKWYRVDVVLNWTTRTSSFWVDGLQIDNSFGFYYSSAGAVPFVNGINLWNNNSTTTWIDELEVVNSEVSLADITISYSGGANVRLSNGIWNGTVTVSSGQASMQIRASRSASGLFYDGYTDVFAVVTPSPSPSATPSRTPSRSASPSNTPSPSVTPSPSPTASVTPSVTSTPSITPTPSSSPSASPTPSPTSSVTPSISVSPSTGFTPSPSVTPSPSESPSSSATPSSGASSSKAKGNTSVIAIGAGVGGGAFCLVGVALVAVFSRRRFRKGGSDQDLSRIGSIEMPMKPTYVASHGLTESEYRWQIRYQDLVIGREIGRGAFGSVFKATWRNSDCVVKQLNIDNTDSQAVSDFLKEAAMVLQLRPHSNVCQIFGVCNNPEYPICIVMEYVAGGSLKDLVYEPLTIPLTFPMALGFAKDIVRGMIHIHAENLLHCDLACRNLLAASQGENSWAIKVSDFGLARASESGIYDAKQEAKFPIRWSAPEVLTDRKVSRASDVWSFGVVLWEVLEGRMPYYELMNNNEVIFAVCTKKEPLPPPAKRIEYPNELYDMMLQCWSYHPADRPSFDEIYSKLVALEPNQKVQEDYGNVVPSSGAHEYNEFMSNSEFDVVPRDSNSNYQGLQEDRVNLRQSIYGNKV